LNLIHESFPRFVPGIRLEIWKFEPLNAHSYWHRKTHHTSRPESAARAPGASAGAQEETTDKPAALFIPPQSLPKRQKRLELI
jgi:hypothetical protein